MGRSPEGTVNGYQRSKAGNRKEKPLPRAAGRRPPLSGRRVCSDHWAAARGASGILPGGTAGYVISTRKPDRRDPENERAGVRAP